ncbi:PaaI family thioesterase [Gordonia rhizosphera]|uniref:Thioesterase domain-containing protein n=1 Tax=Gordonia rhizosphera NBRC 16068 TaxID=1108045 RepID=K6W346_9ACTN|nr:hotdog domain-containing protein [Gordonia rhizosphera]GAB93585.1 hypothetical protein GORHZ_232_00040 [Gordonia rhizosphera NBRC 16068]
MTGTPTTTTPEFVISGAEALLRVSPVALSAQRAELTVAAGQWYGDPVAGNLRGALGVPLDDVTGHVVASGVPQDKWPVSLGIRVDFLADPPVEGSPMTVIGELIARDDRSGTTRGAVVDGAGRTLALVTQRSHLVPVDGQPHSSATQFDTPRPETSIRAALGFRDVTPGVVDLPPTTLAANGMGNLHGGVLIIGSELAAMSAVDAGGVLRTTSIDIVYVRPGNAGDLTTFRSDLLHRGRSVAVVRVVAANASGKPCSISTVIVQS